MAVALADHPHAALLVEREVELDVAPPFGLPLRIRPIILSLSKDERSGLTQQYISDLERGKCNPTIVTLYELAQALGASQVELVCED